MTAASSGQADEGCKEAAGGSGLLGFAKPERAPVVAACTRGERPKTSIRDRPTQFVASRRYPARLSSWRWITGVRRTCFG
jgi:CO/xanthine dehydrogenase Mo-binding subunit